MPENDIKEEVAGTGDKAEIVEMDKLDDGEFEVTLRYVPNADPDSDEVGEAVLCRRRFASRDAAETRYADVVGWIHSLAAPR